MPETVAPSVHHEACPAVSLPTPPGGTVAAPILQMRTSRLKDRNGSHADLVPSPEQKARVHRAPLKLTGWGLHPIL